ncbi:MAG: bifunctional isocitrate dehydrogenase kinase/phosphatase [Gammaproteobacteria bacterium]|nr:bifunctional isocitrate dehydrogenase kinase/phosphatase [Gammaproteobacteria bacterium]NIR83584.1 bifunctional isocitrate dehydrogenase kinase/phosphatase [Gammaproteobacteria bacterium]NIR91506.1 bifunctional isocitrate dehydrogenase kinase/phosphatase [Gammaproteobacteria bacterium]NIU04746.1 bifunctional isocitrate dehydrogenase kinase/phosphatase [Gammaproteobacteria bacterium]NIV51788.1 bifunctional isocitrate dehydrogenase kinase/phosphatase [Gammaproteobacteria bacterium]
MSKITGSMLESARKPETPDPSAEAAGCAERIRRAATDAERIRLAAEWILQEFDAYYAESRRIPALAKAAFEERDHRTSLALSKKRLSQYSVSISELGTRLREALPGVAEEERIWERIERHYLPSIEGRYAADLAFAYFLSVRRKIYQGEWRPVEYAFSSSGERNTQSSTDILRSFPGGTRVTVDTVRDILSIPGFSVPYRDVEDDARRIAARTNRILPAIDGTSPAMRRIEVMNAGFYRNRGAYLVGRIVLANGTILPFIIALLNEEAGIYVDAVLLSEADAHNIFSSTLANFHVTNPYYHELSAFLHSIMPARPLGLHYSTIGFNHVGKVAVMNELKEELKATGEVFETAVGFHGTVAIGFSAPSSNYNLKVIRNKPTEQYKWGIFKGIDWVLSKYSRVHEINRTGSMLDNIIYYNLKLEKAWFNGELLDELLRDASETVFLQGDDVIFKYLIVQRRITPMPVFLSAAALEDAKAAVVNLGHCIKNNAAGNIFNKDLDARNYGVSRFLKVFLFDYDALEPFTEVNICSNADRVEGEEDLPDWYYQEGVVFLPEEIEANLSIPHGELRDLFHEVHGDLMTTAYWERIQNDLRADKVPSVRIYPESCELR